VNRDPTITPPPCHAELLPLEVCPKEVTAEVVIAANDDRITRHNNGITIYLVLFICFSLFAFYFA
jgi:hypothetical protein